MRKLALILALGLASCGTPAAQKQPSPPPSAIAPPAMPVAVQKPALPTCTRKYVALDLEIFNYCILEGMSFVTVSNIIGYAGTPVSVSGNAVIAKWTSGDDGIMMATFVGDRLTAKSQVGLQNCIRYCP